MWKQLHTFPTRRELYNELERSLLGEEDAKYRDITSKIKHFAINLERLNPVDWNDMLSMLLI